MSGVEYAIFEGADIDPSIAPEDAIEAHGRLKTVNAVYQLKKFADGLTRVSDIEFKNAITLCLRIMAKAMHTPE